METNQKLLDFTIITLLVAVLFQYYGSYLFSDFDLGWHIFAGKLIAQNASIPQFDPWSYTSGQEWYNLSWLYDLFVYGIYYIFGERNLNFINSLIFGGLIGYIYIGLENFGKFKTDVKMVVSALAALAMYDLMHMRPQLISYILTLVMLILVEKFNSRPRLSFFVKLFFINFIWVNVHGSFILIYVILGTYCLDKLIQKDFDSAKYFVFASMICLLGTLVNPLGIDIFTGMARTLNSEMTKYIIEWKPMTFGVYYGFSLFLLVFILASDVMHPTTPFRFKFLAFGSLIAALSSMRFFAYAAVLCAPYLAMLLNERLPRAKDNNLSPKMKIATVVILVTAYSIMFINKIGNGFTLNQFPRPLIETMAINFPDLKYFNTYNTGAQLIYYSGANAKIFIDSRAGTVYQESLMQEYMDFFLAKKPINVLYEKYNFDVVFIERELVSYAWTYNFLKNWIVVFEDEKYGLYAKPELAARLSIVFPEIIKE